MTTGYSEQDLVTNRAPVLVYGGREDERRAWAEEAAWNFAAEGPLKTADSAEALKAALSSTRGVVYVPDVGALGYEAQGWLVQALQREERAKWVVGVPTPPDQAIAKGTLRDDLSYRLHLGRLDLGPNEVREAIRARRAAMAKRTEPKPNNAKKAAQKKPAKPATRRPTPAKKPAAKKAKR